MKTTKFLFILLLPMLFGQGVKGQGYEFAPIGATWYYEYNYLLSYGYIKIESVGDTTIQTKNCKILQKTSFGHTYPGYYETINMGREYIFSDTNAVYYYRNNFFYTLFEFGPIGTSWNVVGNSMMNNADSGTVYVDSISVEMINGTLRNVLFLKSTPHSCIGWDNAKIIEGIGVANEYFFPDYIDCVVDANEGSAFRCFFIGDTLIYSTTTANNCNFINQIDEHEIFEINIYPNPAHGEIYLEYPKDFLIAKIKLYAITGRLIKTFPKEEKQLNISSLPPGLYILYVEANGKKFREKIIIDNLKK
jgi:hypothetical protein